MARVKWTSSTSCTRPEWEEHVTFAGSQELLDPEGDEGALTWVARLPRGRSLSEWYDKEQPLESSRDGWQIDHVALRTIGDHKEVIVATSALAGWLGLVRSGQECWTASASHLASHSEAFQRATWPRVRSRHAASGPRSTKPALSAT
jgi:hypothetical protein